MSDAQPDRECSPESEYLVKYVQIWTCRDGRSVILRPIRPEDKTIEKNFIDGLSSESSRYRFFGMIREVTPEMVNHFCNIDDDSEIAILAEYDFSDEKRNVGVGRLVIEPQSPTGEFALVVSDDFQNNGLGTKLLRTLIEIGRERQLKSIYGMVMRANYKMLSLAKKLGFTIEASPYEELRVVLQL